jgi:hypothetical protein
MQVAPLLVLVSLAQGAADGWTAAGTTRGVTMAFRDDPQLEVREVRATSELAFPAARIFRSCVTSRTTDRSCPASKRRR